MVYPLYFIYTYLYKYQHAKVFNPINDRLSLNNSPLILPFRQTTWIQEMRPLEIE
jgi:hypothetical protein